MRPSMPSSDFGPEASPPPVLVPPERLAREVLETIAREYVLREVGNDDPTVYGEPHEAVIQALRRGTHVLVFDPGTETISIIEAREFKRLTEPSDRI